MNGRSAIIFPGMAPSDWNTVGRFMTTSPHVLRRLPEADAALGYRLTERFRLDPHPYSPASQVAYLINSIALADWAHDEMEFRPELCAASSFGIMPALLYTGSLELAEAVDLMAEVTHCETNYYTEHPTDVVSHFVFRISAEAVETILSDMELDPTISAFLDEDFFAVSLPDGLVAELEHRVKAAGGLSLYTMRPGAHYAALSDLRDRVHEVIGKYKFRPPRLPIVSDHDGTLVTSAEEVRSLASARYVNSVRWMDAVRTLRREGVTAVCICGPTNVFSRLCRKHFEVFAANPQKATVSS